MSDLLYLKNDGVSVGVNRLVATNSRDKEMQKMIPVFGHATSVGLASWL